MIAKISSTDFFQYYNEWGHKHVFGAIEMIELQEQCFGIESHYIEFKKKDSVLFVLHHYTKKGVWFAPISIAYQVCAFNPQITSFELVFAEELIIQYIKKFKKGIIRFPPDIKNLELFQHHAIGIKPRFTYYKSRFDTPYGSSVISNLKAIKKHPVHVEINTNLDKSWEMASSFMHTKSDAFKAFCIQCIQQNLCLAFNLNVNNKLIATNWVFINQNSRSAFFYQLSKADRSIKGVHECLYHEMFNTLSKQGYQMIDLGGANMPSITGFKANFNVEIAPYYQVEFNFTWSGKVAHFIRRIANKIAS